MTGHNSRDGLGYTCSLYHSGGRSACYQNRVLETRVLPGIVRLILARYCGDEAIAQLRQAIRTELAAERVLTAPAALVGRLTNKLGELQEQRDRLQAELDAGEAHQQQSGRLDETAEAAISELQTLSEALSTVANPVILQETLHGLIVRISLEFEHRPNGKRTRNTLTGGSILVRLDQVLSSLLFRTSSEWASDNRPRSASGTDAVFPRWSFQRPRSPAPWKRSSSFPRRGSARGRPFRRG